MMFQPQTYQIKKFKNAKNKIGGTDKIWETVGYIDGYLDMLDGSKVNAIQNAMVESSSHVLVTLSVVKWIKSGMHLIAGDKRYEITYIDDPNNIGHHLEIYCRYDGDLEGDN